MSFAYGKKLGPRAVGLGVLLMHFIYIQKAQSLMIKFAPAIPLLMLINSTRNLPETEILLKLHRK